MSDTVTPDAYTESSCLLNMNADDAQVKSIELRRVLQKLDSYLAANDYVSVLRHLNYWLEEARAGNDLKGQFGVYNELMGLHRKCGRKQEAISAVEAALKLVNTLGLSDTITGGTAFVNAATVYKAFFENDNALPLYARAQKIYEKELSKDDERLAGLYNNYALALAEAEEFNISRDYLLRAINIMIANPGTQAQAAVSYLNLADVTAAELGAEESERQIEEYLEYAQALLDAEGNVRNGDYAFICDKCAPCFDHYGWFFYAEELKGRAADIYSDNK